MNKETKTFRVDMNFIFKGFFEVKAQNAEQAEEYVKKHCGLVIGGDIHSSLTDEEITWDFQVHPEKQIKSIKQIKNR